MESTEGYQRYYRPLGQNVLVQPIEDYGEKPWKDTTETGVIKGKTNLKPVIRAKVVSKGPGTPDHPVEVKYNDIVLVGRMSGVPITFGYVTMFVIPQSEILAIL